MGIREGYPMRRNFKAKNGGVARLVSALVVALLFTVAPARAGGPVPPELEFEWASVRAKNNAPWTGLWPHGLPPPFGQPVTVGAVKHNYRIATKPVTNRQWLEFVNAYAPHNGYPNTVLFTGLDIVKQGNEYLMIQAAADRPVVIGWRFAAIYTNWLHNGKADAPEAFTSGAYDVSTFGANPDGTLTDQRTRSPGAKYWIPSADEWVKAMHYDPNRHGEGEGGYWLHPGMQDTPLFTELPENGGQTNSMIYNLYPAGDVPAHALNVGAYPHVLSPWGALDASGGASEWLEDVHASEMARMGRRSGVGEGPGTVADNRYDHIAHFWGGGTTWRMNFRVAAAIPAPGSAAAALPLLILIASRRTRRA